jgi:Uma2 family endonuclease
MPVSPRLLDRDDTPREDHFVHLCRAKWGDYERVLEIRGDHSAPRIAYLDGTLEIMSPSYSHESIKSDIGRLVEVWCLERGIEFSAYGSWTFQIKRLKLGLEPDECYVFGNTRGAERPDLAIEVIWTAGGLDKLEAYAKLGAREVWHWRRGRISVHVLRGARYRRAAGSKVLPGIDLDQLASFLDRQSTSAAIREYRAALKPAESRSA